MFGKTEKIDVVIMEGEGEIKRITIGQKLTKNGNMLEEPMTNKKITISTGQVLIKQKKKIKIGYIVDMDKGCTTTLTKDEGLIKIKTNPELIANVIDSRLIQDAFAIRPHKGILIAVFLVAGAIGFFMDLLF